MKSTHLLFIILMATFTSCSSAYKIGQTPDDVYYSPAPPPPAEYVTAPNQQDQAYTPAPAYNNEDYDIRRGINNPRYRSNLSLDFGFGYNPYSYGSSFYNPYYNPYTYTGVSFYPYNTYDNYSFYSPYYNYYYPNIYSYTTKTGNGLSNYNGPRQYNLGAYTNSNITRTGNSIVPPATSSPVRTFPAPATGTGVGNLIRRVFTPVNNTPVYNNDNNTNNNSTPARTTQINNSGSSSSSSSSGGSAPTRSFRR